MHRAADGLGFSPRREPLQLIGCFEYVHITVQISKDLKADIKQLNVSQERTRTKLKVYYKLGQGVTIMVPTSSRSPPQGHFCSLKASTKSILNLLKLKRAESKILF